MKTIDTLVEDIYEVVEGKGGWDKAASQYFADRLTKTMDSRLVTKDMQSKKGTLRLSALGHSCDRKLWFDVNVEDDKYVDKIESNVLLSFLYGDILEDFLLSLAVAAGHTVEGEQDEMYVCGIKGHRDAVIDGHLVDVKSASDYGFNKFVQGNLRTDDPFGYISQLSSYLHASKDDPLVKDKESASFLVINKANGKLVLDTYNFKKELETKEEDVERIKDISSNPLPPDRGFEEEDDGYTNYKATPKQFVANGNKKLPTTCRYCAYKFICWDKVRVFEVKDRQGKLKGYKYLTKVVKEPKMEEVTDVLGL